MSAYKILKQEIAYQLSKYIPVRIKYGTSKGLQIYGNLFFNRRNKDLSLTEKIYELLDMSHATLVEVGSHIGEYAIYFGKIKSISDLILIEPNPLNCFFINKNLKINKLKKFQLLNIGLGDNCTEITFISDRYNRAKGTFVEEKKNALLRTKKTAFSKLIKIETGDKILKTAANVDYVKIDTEGFETHVLRGLIETIKKHNPIIEFEIHGTTNEQKIQDLTFIYNLLTKYNYHIFKIDYEFPQITNLNLNTHFNGAFISYNIPKLDIDKIINQLKK